MTGEKPKFKYFMVMDELVDILDNTGNLTGQSAMKSEAHRKGLFHPTVHIWFYTGSGKVLLQQRGKHKDTHPLLWDVSVAGHVGAGEDIKSAAVREVKEEIGVSVNENDLEKIGVFKSVHQHSESLIDREFHHTFLCELKTPLASLKPPSQPAATGLSPGLRTFLRVQPTETFDRSQPIAQPRRSIRPER
jgi:isopentenyldiphosphate isomerase